MSTVYPVEAYSFASRFVLRDAAGYFPAGVPVRARKTYLVAEWGEDSIAYAFDFGALVFFNVPADLASGVLATFGRVLPHEPHPPLRESFLVEVGDTAKVAVSVEFDRVVVPALGRNALEVIATVLAQSVAIDYYDEDIQGILNRIGTIATEVAKHGKPRGRTRDLVRFVGAAMASQVEMISAIALLDKPDLTWEDELADRLHDRLRYHLEIRERYLALEAKLTTIRQSLQALLELTQERRMLLLEATVVFLILLEVVLGALRVH